MLKGMEIENRIVTENIADPETDPQCTASCSNETLSLRRLRLTASVLGPPAPSRYYRQPVWNLHISCISTKKRDLFASLQPPEKRRQPVSTHAVDAMCLASCTCTFLFAGLKRSRRGPALRRIQSIWWRLHCIRETGLSFFG